MNHPSQKIVRIGFRYRGSYAQFEPVLPSLVERLCTVPGLLWKIWTYDEGSGRGAGLYLFADERTARAYLDEMVPTMSTMVEEVDPQVLDFHVAATAGTRGPVGDRLVA